MKPEKFFLANATAGNNPEKTGKDSVETLPIFTDGNHCLSRWRLTWRERFSAFFFGTVWMWTKTGKTQPPTVLQASRNAFERTR